MIKIKITKRCNDACLRALKAAVSIYKGDISPTIEILRKGFVEPAIFNDKAVVEFNSYLKGMNLRSPEKLENLINRIGPSLEGERDFSYDDMFLICNNLELIERIWIGQWDHLSDVVEDKYRFDQETMKEIWKLRDNITDAYSRKGLTGYSSYGIYSPYLDDDVRMLYAFQKVYLYEKSAYGVNATPFSLTGELTDDTPRIELPYKETLVFNSYEEIEEYSKTFMEEQRKASNFLSEIKKIHHEDGKFYFPTAPNISYLTEPGDKVERKQNDYFVVTKLNKSRSE